MQAKSRLVLIVEDEKGVCEPLAHLLRLRHFEVVTADTAADALEAIEHHQPDAAIVDMHLRSGSGREVVVGVPSKVPVIIFSGLRSATPELEQLRPQTRFVEKPCSLTWLIDTMADMLSSSRTAA
jgi:two-component system KDP operon response regulator KdpE